MFDQGCRVVVNEDARVEGLEELVHLIGGGGVFGEPISDRHREQTHHNIRHTVQLGDKLEVGGQFVFVIGLFLTH